MNGQTEIKYHVTRQGHLYLAFNKWTARKYCRPVSAPRQWVQGGQLVDNERCIDALEDSVRDYVSRTDSQRRFRRVRGKHAGNLPTNMHMPTVSKAAREPRGNSGRVE